MGNLSVSLVDTEAEFAALRDAWDELLHDSEMLQPCLTWDWLYTWWEEFGAGKKLRILTVHDGKGRLVGLIPLMLGLKSGRRQQKRVIGFIGTEEPARTFYMDVIARRGSEKEVWTEVLAALAVRADEYDVVALRSVHTRGPGYDYLVRYASSLGWSMTVRPDLSVVFGELGSTFEEFVKRAPHERRRSYLRNLEKSLTPNLQAEYRICTSRDELPQYLELVRRLNIARMEQLGLASSRFTIEAFRRHHQRTAKLLWDRGWLRLTSLWLRGRPAAVGMDIRCGPVYYIWQGGMEPELAQHRPLHILYAHRIRTAIAEGAKFFDFGPGEHKYKRQYLATEKHQARVTLTRRGWCGRARAMAALLRQAGSRA